MKNILVTGAAGYLGSLVIAELAQRKHATTPAPFNLVALDVREIPAANQKNGVIYEQEDIRSPQLASILKKHNITIVVHLAAIVTPGRKSDRQLEYAVDVLGTENVLQACLASSVQKIIISSSGAAYGYHADNPALISEHQPLRGNTSFAYAHHKRLIEEMLADYRRRHPELQQVIFRLSTILGEATNNQITALFEKPRLLALKGSDSPFVFIWDKDAVACLITAIFSEKAGIYNLAGDGMLTIHEIAKMLGKKTLTLPPSLLRWILFVLKKLRLTQYGPEQLDFLRYRPVLDNTRLKEEFGFFPQKTSREVFEHYAQARFQK